MAGDVVLRCGDIFDEFFIIKSGKVEIISADGQSRLAILESGAFFGEIAYFFNNKRSTTVKALTECLFLVLNKEKFETILKLFPDERGFLMKVATQRLKTTNKNDLPLREVKKRNFTFIFLKLL